MRAALLGIDLAVSTVGAHDASSQVVRLAEQLTFLEHQHVRTAATLTTLRADCPAAAP